MVLGMKDSLRRLVGLPVHGSRLRPGEFWALQDVSFELARGQCLGIMGVNGSGKTTLLRILNGIYAPDAGSVSLQGRVGALIAAGAGFSAQLTGRENVYINGSLLGIPKREIDRRFDEIVAFADVGAFIDSPVKHYSSGMSVRLGFSVAAVCEPEILLIDEVLAVGDLNFQKKCYEYLHRLKGQGTSIVLVSHSIGAIWSICDEGMLVHKGRIAARGSVEDVIRAYNDKNSEEALSSAMSVAAAHQRSSGAALAANYGGSRGGTGEIVMGSVRCVGPDGQPRTEVAFGGPLRLEAVIEAQVPLRDLVFRFGFDSVHYKQIVCMDSVEQGVSVSLLQPGRYRLVVDLPAQNLMPGLYTINAAVCQRGLGVHLFFECGVSRFRIIHPSDRFLYSEDQAVLFLECSFALQPDDGVLSRAG
jgi:lipopolysaccharide transport system ATP-binding protein